MTLRLVRTHEVDDVWPALREGMEEACRRCGDDVTAWHLLAWVRASNALLFVTEGVTAGIIMRAEQWGNEMVARVIACAGRDLDDWLGDVLAPDAVWRQYLGDLPMVFEGRPGWGRVIKDAKVLRVVYRVG